MSYSNDPISLVQKTLLQIIEESLAVRSTIQNYTKNIIGQDNEIDRRKDSVDESDLPEVVKVLVGLNVQLTASSSHSVLTPSFEVQINSGSFDVTGEQGLNAVQFAVYCALLEAQHGPTLDALQWGGARFVGDVTVQGVVSSESSAVENRGINGWTSIATVSVGMNLSRQKMLEYNSTGLMS